MKSKRSLTVAAVLAVLSPIVAATSCSGDEAVKSVAASSSSTEGGKSSSRSSAASTVASAGGGGTSSVGGSDAGFDASFNLHLPGPGPIKYRGGPIEISTVNVYYVWYGDWKNSPTPAILDDLIVGFDDSSYSKINAGYYQLPPDAGLGGAGGGVPATYATGRVSLKADVSIGYTYGSSLTDSQIFSIVTDELHAGHLPYDPDGAYFVLTSGDVSESSFCSVYCGWHDSGVDNGNRIRYSFVGDAQACLSDCTIRDQYQAAGINVSPNLDWNADGMASVIIHELSELTTDPDPFTGIAWQTPIGWETGDLCAWRFDPTYPTANGSRANVKLGKRDFVIQQMWVNDSNGGHCDLHP